MKQKIDIMKAKVVAEHQLLSQSVLDIHNPGSPTSEDHPYYKNTQGKTFLWKLSNCLHEIWEDIPSLTKLGNYNTTKTHKYPLDFPSSPMQFEFT